MSEESKELVIREDNELISKLPSGKELEGMMAWSEMMSQTPFYKQMVTQGGKFGILAIFGAARELGIPAFQALNGGLWLVQGRVTLSAQMMGLLIRKRGHKITKKIGTKDTCHLIGERSDTKEKCEMIFTIDEAKKAGLIKAGGIWEKYPAVMLYNRTLSMLAKQLFQDAIGNALIEGEIIDITPEEVEPSKLDRVAALFIENYNLNNLNCAASRFIDGLATNMKRDRTEIIATCSKDPERFAEGLKKFKEQEKEDAPKDDVK